MKVKRLFIFLSVLFTGMVIPASAQNIMNLACGKTESGNTSSGSNWTSNWNQCGHNLTGFTGKEAWYKFTGRPSSVHDIKCELEDRDKVGLDYFFWRRKKSNNQWECIFYKQRSGNDNKYYSYTLKNCHPDYDYYCIIDSKGGEGRYYIKGECQNKGYICDDYINLQCGGEKTGHTNNGKNNYDDYTCFDKNLKDFHAKEVVYKVIDRPSYPHDIKIEFYDYDRRGLDLFVFENCGKSNYRCYTYKERSGSDPEKSSFIIYNTDPHKEYYVVIDAKNATGNYKIKAICEGGDYFCEDYKNVKCGETKSGDTKDGKNNYHDYSCFKSHLTGFNAREKVYRITDYPSENYDLEVTFKDIDKRGLDLFFIENCGKNDYRCYAYKERTGSDPQTTTFTLYNLDYRKDYYMVIDAKNSTGRYEFSIKCRKKGYVCEQYKEIECGQKLYGHTKNGHNNYSDYSCYDSHLTGFHAKELVYKVVNRPDYIHDIYIEFEDIFDKGLDIYVVENCGKNDYDCYVYKERSSSSPKKDKLTIPDTDPNKEYYIIIDAKSVHSDFYLSIECEDRTRCYDPCFSYLRRDDGKYDFYWPDADYNRRDYYYWYVRHESSGNDDIHSGGSMFGYRFKYGKGLYKVALLDKGRKILCYYYIYYDDCDNDYPMAKAFDYQQMNCSGNSCFYKLDASSSMGSNLYYHWYFIYNSPSRNTHYVAHKADTTVKVEHANDLISICLVVTNWCGMSSYCIQGDCFNAYPEYSIEATSDRDVEIEFDSWSVNCNQGERKVWVDWGDGKGNEYTYSNNLNPKHKYEKPGYYYVCVRYYYECKGNNYDRGCSICVCKTIVLGECEEVRDFECSWLNYEQGDYVDGKWGYTFSHSNTPSGYTFQNYSITNLGTNEIWQSDGSWNLEPGYEYLVCVVYVNNEGCYYYCCRYIEVFYPTDVNIHLPSRGCGGSGAMIEIPVTVNGLTDVTGFQFRIQVNDADVAQILDTIIDLNDSLPLNPADVTINTVQNFINVAWTTDLIDQAQSLEDGSTLFVFKVMLTGTSGDSTEMIIENPLAFNNLTNQQIDVTFDNGIICVESSVSIQGALTKEDGTPMANTSVQLSGDKSETVQTDENGIYQFLGLLPGYYEVTPGKSQDYHAGVNVIDLAMIKAFNRDANGTNNLSPYQKLASNARVVLDGSQLTVADETAIKRMTNFDIDEFEDYSSSWRFLPKSHSFQNPEMAHTETIPNQLVFESLSNDVTGQDFYGIKVGDINGSVATIAPRSQQEVGLAFSSLQGKRGDTVSISLNGQGFEKIQNIQFTVSWDPSVLTYVGWENGYDPLMLEENSFSARFVDDGRLTFAHSIAPGSVSFADTGIFELVFVIIGTDGASTDVEITGDPVEIIITDDALQPQTVTAMSGNVTIGETTASTRVIKNRSLLGKSSPNPFSNETIIPVHTTVTGPIILSVFNSDGKQVHEIKEQLRPGVHRFRIHSSELGAPGVYYYRLVSAEGYATQSMVLIK